MLKRTCTCGDLRKQNTGETGILSGWVNTYRDQGKGLVFIDLRDRYGLTQVVFDAEDTPENIMELGASLRREDVVTVKGEIRLRDGKPNEKLATGEIELVAKEIEIIKDNLEEYNNYIKASIKRISQNVC